MIGDRLDNDIVPAKALGLKTIWVKQGFASFVPADHGEGYADFVVANLGELADLF